MLEAIRGFTREFLREVEGKSIRVVLRHDCDGITSAAILIKTFKRLDKKFSIRIVKLLTGDVLKEEIDRQTKDVLVFVGFSSESLEPLRMTSSKVFLIDNHEVDIRLLNENVKIVNPYLVGDFSTNSCNAAGICYLFSKEISKDNVDLSKIAVVGMIGDRHEASLSKANQLIINDTKDLTVRKGLVMYPATRPLRRTLEYSTSPYIPGVTGNSEGVVELLREVGISGGKSLLELDEEEMSRLVTAVMIRRANNSRDDNIIGYLYVLKFFNTLEDARELSVLINACSRLDHWDSAILYCLENEGVKNHAIEIYNEYRQEIISGLKLAENVEKIRGNGFVILNVQDKIRDTVVGTVCSMLAGTANYEEGTILIGIAYSKENLKVSARMVGKGSRNMKEVLEQTIVSLKQKNPDASAMVGGYRDSAGCLIEKNLEAGFIEELRRNLEIEVVKV